MSLGLAAFALLCCVSWTSAFSHGSHHCLKDVFFGTFFSDSLCSNLVDIKALKSGVPSLFREAEDRDESCLSEITCLHEPLSTACIRNEITSFRNTTFVVYHDGSRLDITGGPSLYRGDCLPSLQYPNCFFSYHTLDDVRVRLNDLKSAAKDYAENGGRRGYRMDGPAVLRYLKPENHRRDRDHDDDEDGHTSHHRPVHNYWLQALTAFSDSDS